jgi:hypothetical protein
LSSTELTLIRDVSDLLKKLIQDNVIELSGPTSVVLDSPGDIAAPSSTQNQLSLFLYQISENPFLKNQEFRQLTPDKSQYFSLPLDLFYLLTPYAKDREVEQIIIAKLLRLFHDNAVLSGTALGDNLLQSGNNELRIVMNSLSLDQLNQLWGIFAEKSYRLSLSYIVTPLLIPSSREIDSQRVTTKQLDYYQLETRKNIGY